MNKYLPLKWTISRGRDTYGNNICTLWDGRQAYRCSGGGYDMQGTCLALWLEGNYRDRLQRLLVFEGIERLYGIGRGNKDRVYIDGAAGLESMIEIAAAIGLGVTRAYNVKREALEGLFVRDLGVTQ